MSTETTVPAYFHLVTERMLRHRNWRVGQAYYNVLYELRPDLAEQVDRRPELDPFHDDGHLAAFVAFVQSAWNRPVDEEIR